MARIRRGWTVLLGLAAGLACAPEARPAAEIAAPPLVVATPDEPLPAPTVVDPPAPVPARAGSVPPPPAFFGENACRKALCQESPRCCQDWTDGCDGALLRAAYMTTDASPTTGRCYYHDRSACPTCACPYYVKVDGVGFDGGTGCLDSREATIATLLAACGAGRCG